MEPLTQLSAYSYNLPKELIAQRPCTPRDHSRLMVVDRKSGHMTEMRFRDLKELLSPGDSLVLNNTKVIPARLFGQRQTGGKVEVFLVKRLGIDMWEVLSRPARKLKVGTKIDFGKDFFCEVLEERQEGMKVVQFHGDGQFELLLNKYGQMPLPHYIERDTRDPLDVDRYQTVYAKQLGAVAAPTAGLHFTSDLLDDLKKNGIAQHCITLHVGLGTFRPVHSETITDHQMHSEFFDIPKEVAAVLNKKSGRQICVGTTCCRALEAAANAKGMIAPSSKETDIFIYPGYQFKYVDTLLTNFHLPGSTLLMLVSAFGGYDLVMEAYRKAVADKYRFYSYGDAMLIG